MRLIQLLSIKKTAAWINRYSDWTWTRYLRSSPQWHSNGYSKYFLQQIITWKQFCFGRIKSNFDVNPENVHVHFRQTILKPRNVLWHIFKADNHSCSLLERSIVLSIFLKNVFKYFLKSRVSSFDQCLYSWNAIDFFLDSSRDSDRKKHSICIILHKSKYLQIKKKCRKLKNTIILERKILCQQTNDRNKHTKNCQFSLSRHRRQRYG